MDYFDVPGYALTNSYEIAQEAMMFLCGHMGRRMTDTIADGKGGQVTILWACFRHVNAYLSRSERKANNTIQMDDLPKHEITVAFDWDAGEEDYTGVDQRIAAMRLTPKQRELLDCKMAGRSITETARELSVARSSVKSSLRYIRLKYHKSFNHISYCPDIKGLNLTACENGVVERYLRGETIIEIACAFSVTRQAVAKTLKRVRRKSSRAFGDLPPAA